MSKTVPDTENLSAVFSEIEVLCHRNSLSWAENGFSLPVFIKTHMMLLFVVEIYSTRWSQMFLGNCIFHMGLETEWCVEDCVCIYIYVYTHIRFKKNIYQTIWVISCSCFFLCWSVNKTQNKITIKCRIKLAKYFFLPAAPSTFISQ